MSLRTTTPAQLELHLILDKCGTYKTQMIHRWLAKRLRSHLHFTPTSASWINLVERWFASLTEKQIRRGTHRSTRELEQAIRTYVQRNNDQPKPFAWTKTADEILDGVAHSCKRTSETKHLCPFTPRRNRIEA